MLTLRSYQNDAVERVRNSLRSGKDAPLLVSPTRSGKTVIFSYIAKEVQSRNKRVLILVHRIELLRQTAKKLLEYDVRHGLINPNYSGDLTHHVQIANVQTFAKRLKKTRLDYDLIIIDEAHHATAKTWRTAIDEVGKNSPKLKLLGVTATPIRTDGQGLGKHCGGLFDDLVLGPTVTELIKLGFLVEPVIYAPKEKPDLTQVRITAGDYNEQDLFEVMDRPAVIGDAVKHYRQICPNVPTVVFCVSIDHAKHIASEFRAAGFNFQHIDGTMNDETRTTLLKGLETGYIKGLVNCDLISEGFDLPAICCTILLRPTQSLGLYIQMSCRGLTPFEGKNKTFILDHAGNVLTHGFPDEDRTWTLDGNIRRKRGQREFTEDIEKTKQCPLCYAVHRPANICPYCGYVYEVKGVLPEILEGELQIMNRLKQSEDPFNFTPYQKRREVAKSQTLEQLQAIEKERGYKQGWAEHVFNAREMKKNKEEFNI